MLPPQALEQQTPSTQNPDAQSAPVAHVRPVTVTTKLPLLSLPAASRAKQVTVVLPGRKVLPARGVQLTGQVRLVLPSGQLTVSVAVTVKGTSAVPVGPGSARRQPGAGALHAGNTSAGRRVSRTTTTKLFVPTWPVRSVAEQVTSVSPIGKVSPVSTGVEAPKPLLRWQSATSAPSTSSLADAVKGAAAPNGPVASRMSGP